MKQLVPLIFIFTILLLPTSVPAQDDVITTESNSAYFWRTNIDEIDIIDSNVFPHVQLSNTGQVDDLGKASVTWTVETEDGLIPAYSIYNRGESSGIYFVDQTYDNITWFGLLDNIVLIGVRNNITDIIIVTGSGDQIGRSIGGKTTDHQIFANDNTFFIWANNTSLDQPYYYYQNNLGIEGFPTDEVVISASLGAAIIQQSGGNRVFYTGNTANVSVSSELSNNIEIGQVSLVPAVFDFDNQYLYFSDQSTVPFPSNINGFSYFGLQSSIVYDSGTLYEFGNSLEWNIVADIGYNPFDMAIVDIGLYLGTTLKNGLGLVMSGVDVDKDGVPDTVEDYFGSLNTEIDTDGDGISDKAEIYSGTDPIVSDAEKDNDQDLLSNKMEIIKGLDPNNPDSDYGGALDGWEIKYSYNATDASDDRLDEDNDGITNDIESIWNSNPRSSDTDQDGMPDNWEISNTIDPAKNNADEDPDNDGMTNIEEYKRGTDPLVYNSTQLFQGLNYEILLSLLIGIPVGIILARKLSSRLQILS